jgi:hypothetical protein
MRTAFVILFLALLSLPSRLTLAEPPASESASRLESLKNTYSSTMTKIESDASKSISDWPLEYLKGVKSVQQELQRAGDLDGWQVCQKEFDRFQADRSITTNVLVEKPTSLRATQDKYMPPTKLRLPQISNSRSSTSSLSPWAGARPASWPTPWMPRFPR